MYMYYYYCICWFEKGQFSTIIQFFPHNFRTVAAIVIPNDMNILTLSCYTRDEFRATPTSGMGAGQPFRNRRFIP